MTGPAAVVSNITAIAAFLGVTTTSAERLDKALTALNSRIALLDGWRQAKKAVTEGRLAYEDARIQAERLNRQLAATATPTRELTAANTAVRQELERAQTAHKTNLQNLRAVSIAAKEAGLSLKAVRTETEQATKGITAINTLKTAQDRQAANAQRLEDLGVKIPGAAAVITTYAIPMAQQADDHQDRLDRYMAKARPESVGNANRSEADQQQDAAWRDTLEKRLLAISGRTGRSSADLLQGLEAQITRGVSHDEALATLDVISKGATVTKATVQDLSALSVSLRQSMQVSGEEFAQSLDSLFVAGRRGGFEMDKMAKALPALTKQAGDLGMQGTAAVSSLGASLQMAFRATGSSDTAAAGLGMFLDKLKDKDVTKALSDMGIDVAGTVAAAATNKADPLLALMEKLNQATKGDPLILRKLFGDDRLNTILAPMLKDLETFKAISKSSLEDKGSIAGDFAKAGGQFSAQMDRLQTAIANFNAQAGTPLIETFASVAGAAATAINFVTDFAQAFPGVTSVVMHGIVGFAALKMAVHGVRIATALAQMPVLALSTATARAGAASAAGTIRANGFAAALGGLNRINATGLDALTGRLGQVRRAITAVPISSFTQRLSGLAASGFQGAGGLTRLRMASSVAGAGLLALSGLPMRAVATGFRIIGIASMTNPITALPSILLNLAALVIENWESISRYLTPMIDAAKEGIQWAAGLLGLGEAGDKPKSSYANPPAEGGPAPPIAGDDDNGVSAPGHLRRAVATAADDMQATAAPAFETAGEPGGNGNRQGGDTIFNFTINAQPGTDAEAIVRKVIEKLSGTRGGLTVPGFGRANYDPIGV
ncbi:phage tail tape measure protein [Novispirillum itersonii]|uniref:phage tail tape measure protein n=1 Tax=Novispirillum itersonii TaxID=189 RepID=UPI000367BF03|nr:phage tail tape measure protein [Novispirillum itersonii]